MKALAWSIALISLAFVARVSAADKPTPAKSVDEGEGVLVPTMDGGEHDHYWIGLEAHPLSAQQQDDFEVEGDQGLLIEEVTPDSPAAKAGLKVHDILLEAGKKPLKQIADLSAAIQESKDQPLRLEVSRGGKRQAIAVTSAKRPGGGLTFRLVNPEIHLTFAGEAPSKIPKAGEGLPAAMHSVLARAGDSEQPESGDTEAREQIKALLAQRHKLQERFKSLNEKLGSLSNNSDQSAAEGIRTEMHAVERAIEAINRQTVTLELNRGNPDRQKLIRQLTTLRQCANDLAEVGRTDDASHLGSAAHDIEQQLQAIDLRAEQRRLLRVNDAIQLLNQNGMQEQAELLWDASQQLRRAIERRENESDRQQSEAIVREQQKRRETADGRAGPLSPDPAIAGLRDQIEQMHREMAELKQSVERMSQRKD